MKRRLRAMLTIILCMTICLSLIPSAAAGEIKIAEAESALEEELISVIDPKEEACAKEEAVNPTDTDDSGIRCDSRTWLDCSNLTITPNLTAVREGDDLTLTLTASNDLVNCCGMRVCFQAPEGFTYKEGTISVHPGFSDFNFNKDLLSILMDSVNKGFLLAADTPIVSFKLTLPAGLQPGTYLFSAKIEEAYDWCFRDYSLCGQTSACSYVELLLPPVIQHSPKSVCAKEGMTASFTVAASGAESYQWQYRTSSTGTWYVSTLTGAKTATLSVPVTTGRNGYQYRCKVTNAAGSVLSESAKLTVVKTPEITVQPMSKTAVPGDTVEFKVAATGGALSYQWQYRTSSTGTWYVSTLTGAKTATLSVPATTGRNGYQYRCKVTNAAGNVLSEIATLSVLAKPEITTQPTSKTLKEGTTASFTVAASGAESYQWQYRTSSTGTWYISTLTGAKTATLSVPATPGRNGYQYRCKVTNAAGSVLSEIATLTVQTKPEITTQPTSKTATAGDTVEFKVAATGGALSYQWQYRTSSTGTWYVSTLTGAKTATLSVPATPGRNGYQYRCKVTNAAGSVLSKIATLTVQTKPEITTQPTSKTAAVGDTVEFKVAATGDGLSYQWQYRKNSSDTWKSSGSAGNKTPILTLTATEARNGFQFRCRVTDGAETMYSNTVTLTVLG